MPTMCAVYGCSNKHGANKENNRSYYRLSKVIANQGDRTKELSLARRVKWLANIGRADIKESSYKHIRVCSDHFMDKPAALYDHLNPDWAPTVNMGRTSPSDSMLSGSASDRYTRSVQRSVKRKRQDAAETLLSLQSAPELDTPEDPQEDPQEDLHEDPLPAETGTACQTDDDMKLYDAKDAEIYRLRKENEELKQINEKRTFDMAFLKMMMCWLDITLGCKITIFSSVYLITLNQILLFNAKVY
ncbi:uncharacterized protein LOC106156338 [Lingula anatina]|uniref:Uncharacterized protein LOC106156338 n=1 Tax=Lingula anatina TaxID=7574 RepID=A0A2R2MJB0_LINAN|nr:uncharacterized protein LOC106156338 [Lingula anatina]|eukprot:XP_023930162.1 uncharacterized protein LOC106156338 [Lingula anatina]